MEYGPKFARDFMHRTLTIAQEYVGPFEATLPINCLLGLLVVPKETLIDKIPQSPFERLSDWGILPKSIKRFGKCDYGHEHSPNLRQLVRRMRNAVAHFRIDPVHKGGEVAAFSFCDKNWFSCSAVAV